MIGCLIIHGFTGGPYEVTPLATYLKEHTDWHVEVPTLPGHGEKLDLKDASYKQWITTAEDALKEMHENYETIYLIGFSMGGMIAAYLAAKYSVDKLVLLAASGKYLSFKQIAADVRYVVSDGIKGMLSENRLYNHYRNKLGMVPLKANVEFIKLVRFTRPYLKKVESPVLIAQGQQDGMVPYKTVYYLDKEIHSEQKEVVLFERSRHLICLGEDKDTLNLMVHDFLLED
ncbi:alpha/beta fold hydrolase [Oceanobacillus piezotolerans]|uniref:Alpha/beta fold hydrolase n=1 Tax=Oceanobacillus piezotolerans TaxID=2448030 RepID=A0A498DJL3_9BACI|nr:alpha/beta fold hydrolase [Oceanobacillus piezotolerans]RLL42126.1 alpha/beta fold hydrolase [Oceanobacillus piezotolerans]